MIRCYVIVFVMRTKIVSHRYTLIFLSQDQYKKELKKTVKDNRVRTYLRTYVNKYVSKFQARDGNDFV